MEFLKKFYDFMYDPMSCRFAGILCLCDALHEMDHRCFCFKALAAATLLTLSEHGTLFKKKG